jgi:hypothetical protein
MRPHAAANITRVQAGPNRISPLTTLASQHLAFDLMIPGDVRFGLLYAAPFGP